MKPKTETAQSANAHVPTSKMMGRTDQITAAKLDALYRAVLELKGGSAPDLKKAFEDAGDE